MRQAQLATAAASVPVLDPVERGRPSFGDRGPVAEARSLSPLMQISAHVPRALFHLLRRPDTVIDSLFIFFFSFFQKTGWVGNSA